MIKVTIIALSKLKEKYLKDASDEYLKRLSRYCKLQVVEIEPERLNDNPSQNEINSALEKEAQAVFKRIPESSYVAAMCLEGKKLSSEDFAKTLSSAQFSSGGITFIIGSSYGLADSVKKRADICLSVSDMTFPHQLFRIMLLEQIYRGFKINEGSAYHK